MNDIAQLLGTKDKKEQARRIGNLQQAVQVQPVDLMIRFDPRTARSQGSPPSEGSSMQTKSASS